MNRFGPGQMLAWRRVLAANDNGLLLCTKSCYMYMYDHTYQFVKYFCCIAGFIAVIKMQS